MKHAFEGFFGGWRDILGLKLSHVFARVFLHERSWSGDVILPQKGGSVSTQEILKTSQPKTHPEKDDG